MNLPYLFIINALRGKVPSAFRATVSLHLSQSLKTFAGRLRKRLAERTSRGGEKS